MTLDRRAVLQALIRRLVNRAASWSIEPRPGDDERIELTIAAIESVLERTSRRAPPTDGP